MAAVMLDRLGLSTTLPIPQTGDAPSRLRLPCGRPTRAGARHRPLPRTATPHGPRSRAFDEGIGNHDSYLGERGGRAGEYQRRLTLSRAWYPPVLHNER